MQFFTKKKHFFQNVLEDTFYHINKNKSLNIFNSFDSFNCVERLLDLQTKLNKMVFNENFSQKDENINLIQHMNNEISSILKNFGTFHFEDFLLICFGNSFKNVFINSDKNEYELLKKYFHPINYHILITIPNTSPHSGDSKEFIFNKNEIDGFSFVMEDLIMDTDNFFLKVHGCKLVIVLNSAKKIIIDGIMDDVIIQLLNNDFVLNKLNLLRNNLNENNYISTEIFESYLYSLTLKDLFLINENHLLSNLMGSIAYTNSLRNKPLSQVVKEFNLGDLFFKRNVILNLCINSSIENK